MQLSGFFFYFTFLMRSVFKIFVEFSNTASVLRFGFLIPEACGILALLPGIKLTSPVLEGKVSTTELPRKFHNSEGSSDHGLGDQTSLKSGAFMTKCQAWSFAVLGYRRLELLKFCIRSPLAFPFCLELVINQVYDLLSLEKLKKKNCMEDLFRARP